MRSARAWASFFALRMPAPLRAFRRIPFLGNIIHSVSLFLLPADQMVWAQVRSGPARGLWIEVYPRSGEFHLAGNAELTTQTVIAERLRPGDVFYDLGANIGLYSLMAARCVGDSGKVFSFEPDAVVAERLGRNVARNSFSQVTIVESGVWSVSGALEFTPASHASPDRGLGTFLPSDARAPSTPIRVTSLDDFVRNAPLPDAIKCDVEGAEVEVLRGAEHLLKTHRPWILAEMHSESNERAWREFLARFGYAFTAVDSNHVLAIAGSSTATVEVPSNNYSMKQSTSCAPIADSQNARDKIENAT